MPFENTLDVVELRGDHLLETLEHNMLPSSGIKIVYNITNPIGRRVVSLNVLCNECTVPTYYPLDVTKWYRVIVNSYMAGGSDGFSIIEKHKRNHVVGPRDMDVLIKYLELMSPIMIGIEGRTTILN